jgi:hypothetical protein
LRPFSLIALVSVELFCFKLCRVQSDDWRGCGVVADGRDDAWCCKAAGAAAGDIYSQRKETKKKSKRNQKEITHIWQQRGHGGTVKKA